jgi:hypothetical protein
MVSPLPLVDDDLVCLSRLVLFSSRHDRFPVLNTSDHGCNN